MPTLSDLARLRAQGKAPALPVFVTRNRTLARNAEAIGAFVIDNPGDWSALAGLDVIVEGVSPETAVAIRGARPRRLQSLCETGLTVIA